MKNSTLKGALGGVALRGFQPSRRLGPFAVLFVLIAALVSATACGGKEKGGRRGERPPNAGAPGEAGGKGAGARQQEVGEEAGEGAGEGDNGKEKSAENTDVSALRALPYVGFSDPRHGETPIGVTTYAPNFALKGYTLVTTRLLCTSELLDMSGSVVNEWKQPCSFWENVHLLPNGDLLVVGAEPEPEQAAEADQNATPNQKPGDRAARRQRHRESDPQNYLMRLSWDNAVIWKRALPVHHDVEPLPDGRLVVLTATKRTFPDIADSYEANDDGIAVLSSEGEMVESLSAYDLLAAAPEPYRFHTGSWQFWKGWFGKDPFYRFQVVEADKGGGKLPDLLHSNTLSPFPEGGVGRVGPANLPDNPLYDPDNVLLTSRHQDVISIVSLSKKKVLWAWGPGEVMGPHDATWLGNGNIMLLDNGLGRGWSRVVEVDPMTNEIVWQYKSDPPGDFYTLTRGGAQRLRNGDTLITESDMGRLFEVTSDGVKVWEYYTPHRNERGQVASVTLAWRFTGSVIDPLLAAHPKTSERNGL